MTMMQNISSIKCFIDKDSKKSKLIINENKVKWLELNRVKEPLDNSNDALILNTLHKIHICINELNSLDDDILNKHIKIYVNKKDVKPFLFTDGKIQKRSKTLNKQIENEKIKSLSGIIIHELLKFNNLEILFGNFTLEKGVNNMSNTLIYGQEEDFNLDSLDFSSLENFETNQETQQDDNSDNSSELFGDFNIDDEILEDEQDYLQDKQNNNEDFTEYIYESNTYKPTEMQRDITYNKSNDINLNEDYANDEDANVDLDIDTDLDMDIDLDIDANIDADINLDIDTDLNLDINTDFSQTSKHDIHSNEQLIDVTNTKKFETFSSNKKEAVQKTVKKEEVSKKDVKHTKPNPQKNLTKKSKEEENFNADFVNNEIKELKAYLEKKISSYEKTINELNVKYEQKHAALKDLSFTDEDNSLKIFKDFLNCKTTIVNLNKVVKIYSQVLKDIEEEMLDIIQ